MTTCVAFMDGTPASTPNIRKEDFSHLTHPLLVEYVEASGELVEKFPPRALVLAAILSWNRVLQWSRDAGRGLKELEAEKERVKAQRRVSLTLL